MKKPIIVSIIILGIIIFFWPKTSGRLINTTRMDCQCFGIETTSAIHDSSKSICYGISYRCETRDVFK